MKPVNLMEREEWAINDGILSQSLPIPSAIATESRTNEGKLDISTSSQPEGGRRRELGLMEREEEREITFLAAQNIPRQIST